MTWQTPHPSFSHFVLASFDVIHSLLHANRRSVANLPLFFRTALCRRLRNPVVVCCKKSYFCLSIEIGPLWHIIWILKLWLIFRSNKWKKCISWCFLEDKLAQECVTMVYVIYQTHILRVCLDYWLECLCFNYSSEKWSKICFFFIIFSFIYVMYRIFLTASVV
jgi:hypothetical protein